MHFIASTVEHTTFPHEQLRCYVIINNYKCCGTMLILAPKLRATTPTGNIYQLGDTRNANVMLVCKLKCNQCTNTRYSRYDKHTLLLTRNTCNLSLMSTAMIFNHDSDIPVHYALDRSSRPTGSTESPSCVAFSPTLSPPHTTATR